MPIEKVRDIIGALAPGYPGDEVVEAALKSRRQDVIVVCMDVFETSATLSHKVWKMEDCNLKGQLLVLKLRHGKFWEDGIPLQKMNQQSMQANFFLPMVRQYLPETPIDYATISSPERRKALAERLEVAVKQKWGIEDAAASLESKHEGLIPAPTQEDASVVKSQPPANQSATPKKAPSSAPAASAPGEEPASSTPWSVLVILIVAALGLLWLVFKRRS